MKSYQQLFAELKRRKVFKVAGVYGVVAFVLLQVADLLGQGLRLPESFMPFITAVVLLGFPLALMLAWAFEVTPDGVQMRRGELVAVPDSARQYLRPEDFMILGEPDSAAVALTRAGQPGLAIQKTLYQLWHPAFDPIRSHPTVRDYMARIDLSDATVRRTPPARREVPTILRRAEDADARAPAADTGAAGPNR